MDFPDIARAACAPVVIREAERAILVCGTGIGASIAANKIPGVRAALANDHDSAHQAVEHDDANVLCVGAQIVGEWVGLEIVRAFLAARWDKREELSAGSVLAELEREAAKGGPVSRLTAGEPKTIVVFGSINRDIRRQPTG